MSLEESTRTGRRIHLRSGARTGRLSVGTESGNGKAARCPHCGAEKTRAGLMCPVCFYWDSENTPVAPTNEAEGTDTGPAANSDICDYIGVLILFAVGLMIMAWAWAEHLEDEMSSGQNLDEAEDILSQIETADGMWKSGIIIAALGAAALAFATRRYLAANRRT